MSDCANKVRSRTMCLLKLSVPASPQQQSGGTHVPVTISELHTEDVCIRPGRDQGMVSPRSFSLLQQVHTCPRGFLFPFRVSATSCSGTCSINSDPIAWGRTATSPSPDPSCLENDQWSCSEQAGLVIFEEVILQSKAPLPLLFACVVSEEIGHNHTRYLGYSPSSIVPLLNSTLFPVSPPGGLGHQSFHMQLCRSLTAQTPQSTGWEYELKPILCSAC